jgi:hypothetical protein
MTTFVDGVAAPVAHVMPAVDQLRFVLAPSRIRANWGEEVLVSSDALARTVLRGAFEGLPIRLYTRSGTRTHPRGSFRRLAHLDAGRLVRAQMRNGVVGADVEVLACPLGAQLLAGLLRDGEAGVSLVFRWEFEGDVVHALEPVAIDIVERPAMHSRIFHFTGPRPAAPNLQEAGAIRR